MDAARRRRLLPLPAPATPRPRPIEYFHDARETSTYLAPIAHPPSLTPHPPPSTHPPHQAAQVDLLEFRERFKKPVGICIGLVCQFLFLPLAGFCCVKIFFADNPVYGVPLLVTVSSPGGSYSNWWCSLFNADLPLSMAMTTASSLLAVVALPVNILVYITLAYPDAGDVVLDWGGLFLSLGVVVVGICGGLYVGQKKDEWRPNLNKIGNTAGVALIFLGLFFSSNSSSPIWARDSNFYAGTTLPCLFGLVLSLAFAYACRLPKPQCLSVTIETCYQNTAIALAVILASFSNDDAALCAEFGYAADEKCDVVGAAAGGADVLPGRAGDIAGDRVLERVEE